MKQGQASGSNAGTTKREPIVHVVSPKQAGQIGLAQSKPVGAFQNRGASSPSPAGCTAHKSGSQGKHG